MRVFEQKEHVERKITGVDLRDEGIAIIRPAVMLRELPNNDRRVRKRLCYGLSENRRVFAQTEGITVNDATRQRAIASVRLKDRRYDLWSFP